MELILIGLIVAIILGSSSIVDALLDSVIPIAFYAEKYMLTALTGHTLDFSGLFNLFFSFGVSLIVLKFLKKGFEVYIGWNDGDPDADPLNLVTNFLRAMVIAICFPLLYDTLIDITGQMIDQTIAAINTLPEQQNLIDTIVNLISNSIFQALAGLILVICYCILYLQFMMRGVEMLVMRIGLPIVCTGLIDSDKGIFAPYLKKFFMNAATVLIQIVLIKLSLTVMVLGNCFYSLAIALVAMRTPRFLQEFMLVSGNGGVMNTVYHTSRLYQMTRAAIAKGGK